MDTRVEGRARRLSKWYVQIMGEVSGPISSAELRQQAQQGRIGHDALVRKGEDGDWVLIDRIKGLFDSSGSPVGTAAPPRRPVAIPDDPPIKERRPPGRREQREPEPVEEKPVDDRPPWYKKRYLFSALVVLSVAGYFVYSLARETGRQQVLSERVFETKPTFETFEEELAWHELKLKNLGATARALMEELISEFQVRFNPQGRVSDDEVKAFRQDIELPQIELYAKYSENIASDRSKELIDEYIALMMEMEAARDELQELQHNNPTQNKVRLLHASLDRLNDSVIRNFILLHKLAATRGPQTDAQAQPLP